MEYVKVDLFLCAKWTGYEWRNILIYWMYIEDWYLLWHVDLLLGSDLEIGDCTVAVARQQPMNSNREMVFFMWSAKK
jgi:hypothetical protein